MTVPATVLVRSRVEHGTSARMADMVTFHSLASGVVVGVMPIATTLQTRRRRQAVERRPMLAVGKLGRRRYGRLVVSGSLASPAVVSSRRALGDGRDVARNWALGAWIEARNLVGAEGFVLQLVRDTPSLAGWRMNVFRGTGRTRICPALGVVGRVWASLAVRVCG